MLHRSKVKDGDRDRDNINIEEGRDNIEEDRDLDNEYKHAKLMHVFGYDLTSFSSLIQ